MAPRTSPWTIASPGSIAVPASQFDTSGRDREIAMAGDLLADDSVRLVTFTGPAGVGKTWTAYALGRRLVELGRSKQVAVPVENIQGYDDLLEAVAAAVAVSPGTADLAERVAAVLALEPHVLLLDGCERLAGSPHPVARLLDRFPTLRLVTTSLAPLRVKGERVVGLDPFAIPAATATTEELRDNAAVQLFCRRAAEVDPGFDPEQADLASIAEICRRVHALPLGIEIMASRAGAESPSAMVEYLDTGQDISFEHVRSSDDRRHLSIESALAWSYAMLEPEAARLLRRMTVFAGPATVDMLATVAAAAPSEDDRPRPAYSEILDTVSTLVDRRLVDPHRGRGEPAFVVVELVREFALERLVDEGEQAWTEEARTRAVLDFALARGDGIESADDVLAVRELARSEADLRSTLRRLVGRGDVVEGLRLATAIAPFVLRRGYDGFVLPALSSLLKRARRAVIDDTLLARAAIWEARLAAESLGPDAAKQVRAELDEAMRLARRSGDAQTILLGLSFVMQTLPVTGDYLGAGAAAAEGMPLAEASGDARWVARFCAWAGMVAHQTGRIDEALELARRGVEWADACGDARAEIVLALLLAGLPTESAAGMMSRLPPVDDLIETAHRLDPRYEPFVIRMAAALALRDGDVSTAAARCVDCLRLAQRQAAWHDLPYAILVLTFVAVARNDLADAARFHGMVRPKLELLRPGAPPGWYDEYLLTVGGLRSSLGPEVFESLAQRGEQEMRSDALARALAYAESVSSVGRPDVRQPIPVPRRGQPEQLTPREREVLEELMTGATNKEISLRLGMSPKTVMHHSVAIYRKLGVRGRAEATAWAFRNGMGG